MRGKVYGLCVKGVMQERDFLIGEGDFNLLPGPPNTGRAESEAMFTMPGRGVVGRLEEARVVIVAGFGIRVVGLESLLVKAGPMRVCQEWWFVPAGHEVQD